VSSTRVFSLDRVRADGWFEGIRASSPNIERIIELVGEMPLAFSIILGVQITAISLDPRNRDASIVDFIVGEETETHRMALGEFRRRIAVSLAGETPVSESLPEEPEAADLERFVGSQYLLLAALFGISMREVVVEEGAPPRVRVDAGRALDELALEDVRQAMRERVLAEAPAEAQQAAPFSIDLSIIPKADDAARRGDHGQVISLLGAWGNPLSVLLRTAEGQHLGPDVKSSLAHALGLLGTSYSKLGQVEVAEEVMRLGIQWAQDGIAASDLFRRLGESYLADNRAGEAIGLLRRSISLGAQHRTVLPLLARAFADRGKMVAAAACVDEASAVGVPEAELADVRARALAVLGASWAAFRGLAPTPSTKARTIRPRGRG
jgi:tetratricopeptide (TPR) repeat protein